MRLRRHIGVLSRNDRGGMSIKTVTALRSTIGEGSASAQRKAKKVLDIPVDHLYSIINYHH